VVGTGRGGALECAGEILAAMLAALKDFTSNNDIDVAMKKEGSGLEKGIFHLDSFCP
jgi:hypothetical protein